MVRPASEAMYVAAEEKERSRITSDNCTETTSLNSVIYNLIERKQHEHYKVQGRKRLEALSHDVSHENE